MSVKCVSNVPDRRDENGKWVRSFRTFENGVPVSNRTRACVLWTTLTERQRLRYRLQYPTYNDVVNLFESFQQLAEWANNEPGYLNKEENGRFWALDKDIVVPGNRVYSPETCCFVPHSFNGLLAFANSARGDYPLGVSFRPKLNKFIAFCAKDGKNEYLGLYDTKEEAHRAWQACKVKRLLEASRSDKCCTEKVRKGLILHADLIEQDLLNFKETVR